MDKLIILDSENPLNSKVDFSQLAIRKPVTKKEFEAFLDNKEKKVFTDSVNVLAMIEAIRLELKNMKPGDWEKFSFL